MSPTMPRRRGFAARFAVALGALAIGAATVACSSNDDVAETSPVTTGSGEWPRTVETADGPVTLETQPERIVSTSVTLTGSLLALDAPLVGTGAQPPSSGANSATTEQGLFRQWAEVAAERDVETLYQGEINVERITAAAPDLIIVSASGADSTKDSYDVLSRIAPTLVFDYTDKSWQEITTQLADAIGAEDRATELITEFDTKVDEARAAIAPALAESDEANILTYNSPQDSRIFTAVSAQGQLAERLGLVTAALPEDIENADKGTMAGRADVVPAGVENLSRALPGTVTFIISADESAEERMKTDTLLAETPSVQSGRIYALGFDSFRLDYYSANNVVDRIVDALT
ncbi:Fe2+-enterobactin ABC transporter substrate-binding protein [Rhodococcus phenolicus]|uniref:Fe2+-enterobactin ABC transporter substrate-binding protein n=1 Tax=Rhodococcus phenolicus TaxID=263849 RepID=UPI000B07DE90|nr:Fe2+-enterobactin ABC transporter substrate-binding protein [Rhodococcus phenolicus]